MADETPKLIQIGKGGPGIKKDGFNLISEKVVKVDVENRTLEIELLAYEGKTVMLEVGEDLVEELKKIKPGDGVTVRVVEEEPGGALHGAPTKRRMVKGITIRARDAQKTRVEEMLAALHESHWLTRKYAVEVLGTLSDPRAVGPLIEALTDEVNDIRQRAYESLIKIGAPSVPAVASLATDEDDDVRRVAAEVHKDGRFEIPFDPLELQVSQLVPLGHEHQRFGARGGVVGVRAERDAREELPRLVHPGGVIGADRRAFFLEHRDDLQRRGVPQVVGVGLEGKPEHRDALARYGSSHSGDDLLHHARPLLDVGAGGRLGDLHETARVAAGLDHRRDVFGKTRPAVAGPRVKELGPDAMVEPHGFGHHLHVRSHPLAEIRHLVDKGHLGGQERVGVVIDHLRGRDVREDERGFDQVQGAVQVAHDRLGLRAVSADDHAVGRSEERRVGEEGWW